MEQDQQEQQQNQSEQQQQNQDNGENQQQINNDANTNSENQIQKEAISQESKQALREIFNKFDKDKSGQIDYKEIKNIAQELDIQINEDETNKIFKDLDINQDGLIDFEEFWSWWSKGRPNKLEKLVYFKLKYLKLLKKANSNFTRLGGALDQKYEQDLETQYIALNYGEQKGELRIDVRAYLEHPLAQIEIQNTCNGLNIDKDELEKGLLLSLQFSCSEDNKQTLKKQLENIIEETKDIIGTLGGPSALLIVESLQINIVELEKNKICVTILFDENLVGETLENGQIQMLKQMVKVSQTYLDFSIGLKNSLESIIQNPDKKFVKTLLEGFLAELKVEMNKEFFKQIRMLATNYLQQNINQMDKTDAYITAVFSLLHSTKFHATFKDFDDIEKIFQDLGISQLAEEQPSNQDMLQELAEELEMMGPVEMLMSDEFPFKQFFTELQDIAEPQLKISLIHSNNIINLNFNIKGLGQMYQQILKQAKEYEEFIKNEDEQQQP